MTRRSALTLVTLGALVVMTGRVSAHHSFTQFDRETEIVTTGEIVRWAFNNPHSWLYIEVEDSGGAKTLWSFEGSSPTSLITRGVTGSTFEPGSMITLMYCPLADGRPGGHLGWARLGDGTYVNPSDGGCNGNAENIDRWKEWLEQGYTSKAEALAAAR